VADLAYRKAAAVRMTLDGDSVGVVLGADTVAECDGFVLGKPRDELDARAMLTQLSGREHRVLTGVCLWRLDRDVPLIRVAVSKLRMDRLTDAQLDEYIASGQWEGKAGSFGYQDRLGWVHVVEGSESNVVGLPMELLAEMIGEIVAVDEG
jgi:septum formation protein